MHQSQTRRAAQSKAWQRTLDECVGARLDYADDAAVLGVRTAIAF